MSAVLVICKGRFVRQCVQPMLYVHWWKSAFVCEKQFPFGMQAAFMFVFVRQAAESAQASRVSVCLTTCILP